MFNFSEINYQSLVGKVLRLPLRLLPGTMAVRIRQGRLRGKRWIVGASDHGCWLGSYEFDKQNLIADTVKPNTVFFDVGAHVGFYTLLASVLVQDGGQVLAFEPFPQNVATIKRHLQLNAVGNVTLFEAAVSDRPGDARFQEGPTTSMGKIHDQGALVVETASLDDLHRRGVVPLPDYIKIDVEGAELSVLQGARHVLTVARPTIFLATHGPQARTQCLSLLESLGYDCRSLTPAERPDWCDEILATKASESHRPAEGPKSMSNGLRS